MKTRFCMLLLLPLIPMTFASHASAHGEDKLGPNGGYIQMPGAFHTEVVASDPTRLKVYLLDINWKNPIVKDSSVQARFLGPTEMADLGKSVKPAPMLNCAAFSDHFVCEVPKSINLLSPGTLLIQARRAKQTGIMATYSLPLSLKVADPVKKSEKKDDHQHHH